jgi:hypothetical protein
MSGLREAFDQIVADVPVYGDLDRAIGQAESDRRRRYGVVAGVAAAAAVVAVIIGMLAITRDGSTSPQPVHPSPTPTKKHTALDPVQLNGQITSAEQYLWGKASDYDWRSFDPVSETGLFVIRNSGDELEGLGIAGRTGLVARLTCADDLPCPPEDSDVATLGPGADEVTVASGDGAAQVIGYDGTVRRTLDLGATTTDGAALRDLRWSADGSRLAIVTGRDLEPGCDRVSQLWLLDQGGGEAQLAYSLLFDCAALNNQPSNHDASGFDGKGEIFRRSGWGWSPDGQTLLLDVYRGTQSSDVVLLHLQPPGAADPAVAQNLYHSNRHFDWAGNVAWSPDGTRIAVRTAHLALPNTGPIMEISASDGRKLAEHPDNGGWVIWPAREG